MLLGFLEQLYINVSNAQGPKAPNCYIMSGVGRDKNESHVVARTSNLILVSTYSLRLMSNLKYYIPNARGICYA